MSIVMKAQDKKVLKTFRINPKTLDDIQLLTEKTGLNQRDVIEKAIELLKEKEKLA